jgi:hypothetical protein
VAIVTDGTAVLGLGDIGPAAAMPVMEGKAGCTSGTRMCWSGTVSKILAVNSVGVGVSTHEGSGWVQQVAL